MYMIFHHRCLIDSLLYFANFHYILVVEFPYPTGSTHPTGISTHAHPNIVNRTATFDFPFTFTSSPSSPANGPLITRIFSPGANGDVFILIASSE